ncbi:MAG: class I adenylate-forming enzyme family protein, partial [Desulfosalsimonas sp.]
GSLNFLLRLLGTRAVGWVTGKGISLLVWLTKKSPSKGRTEKRGTAGIPYPDTVIKLVDVDTGKTLTSQEMTEGRPGELCMKGPQRMLGYWPEPGSGLDEEGYVQTSDVVKIDDRGYFYIVDRTKDMIIVSGYKVYSRELEETLYSHPKVSLAAVIGIPDPEREGSERVAVYLQPDSRYKDQILESEIIEYLRQRVAKYAVPRAVRIVDEIPQTEVQKVDKKKLREIAKREFAENLSANQASISSGSG